jgi:hypothetical protein
MRKAEVNFLSIPIKKPDRLCWTPALLKYISTSYAEDTKMYENDCLLLDALRKRCLEHEQLDYSFLLEDLSM